MVDLAAVSGCAALSSSVPMVADLEDNTGDGGLLAGPPPEGIPVGPRRPVNHRVDLTGPELLFVATVFQIRDGDAICVRNARLSKLRKVIQFFTAALVPARATATFAP